jgi:predicted RNA polymerase sigma factor
MAREATSAAEAVARRSYGKLVAFLAARMGDVEAAEDALPSPPPSPTGMPAAFPTIPRAGW